MAKKDDEQQPQSSTDVLALVKAIGELPHDAQKALLAQAGLVPTTQGLSTENLQVIMGSLTAASLGAMKEASRSNRTENPSYPEQSVFNPRGRFDHDGNAQKPKVAFSRVTIHNGVRLGGELETEEEIELFNAFTCDKTARDGRWTLEILFKGTSKERCVLTTPSLTADDRMENALPLPLILRELHGGADAVNPATLQKRIEELERKLANAGAAA